MLASCFLAVNFLHLFSWDCERGRERGKREKGEEKDRRRKRKKKEERLFPSVSISGSTKTTPHYFDHNISPLI
jgi:hypothetical protein